MKTKIDQWIADSWLAGIPAREIAQAMRASGRSDDVIDAALDVYEGLDMWSQRSLERLAASCADWREF